MKEEEKRFFSLNGNNFLIFWRHKRNDLQNPQISNLRPTHLVLFHAE